jgi:hypothetical protein
MAHRGIWVEPSLLAEIEICRGQGAASVLQGSVERPGMKDESKMIWIYVVTNHDVGGAGKLIL